MIDTIEKAGNEVVPATPELAISEAAEAASAAEIASESEVLDEVGLEKLVEQVGGQIEAGERQVLGNAEKQIVPPPSLCIEQAKADTILERGGFAARIQEVRVKIMDLTRAAKEKITALIGTAPDVIHFKEMANQENRTEVKMAEPVIATAPEQALPPQPEIRKDNEAQKMSVSVKTFSKEQLAVDRVAAVAEIKQLRQSYFEKQQAFKTTLDSILQDAEAKRIEGAEVKSRIELAERDLGDRSENIMKRLFYYRSIHKLKAELAEDRLSEENITQELADLEAAQAQTETLMQDKSALAEARRKLDDFYHGADEAWNHYEDDRDAGSIANIARDRDALLVHAFINPTLSPSDENGVVRKELGWRDRLDLLMALEPSISASAINQKYTKTFAPVGVLIGEGHVAAASARDMGTKAAGRNERAVRQSMPDRVREQIDEALNPENSEQGWTEFVVNEPKVAGMFFRVESDGKLADLTFGSDATIEEVVASAQERNLPLFALCDGNFYPVNPEEALALGISIETVQTERVGLNTYSKKTREYPRFTRDKREAFSPKSLAELSHGVDDASREKIIEQFMENSPFQLRQFPEAMQVAIRADGRSYYHLFNSPDKNNENQKATIPIGAIGNVKPLEVSILKTIPGPVSMDHIVRLGDGSIGIWQESRNPVSDESRYRAGSEYHQDRLIGQNISLYIGGYSIPSEHPIANINDVVQSVKKELDKTMPNIQVDSYSAEFHKNYCSKLSVFLHGIAEEARTAGDTETADTAERAASQMISFDAYQDMIKRRVSENGTFKLTREELIGG